MSNSKRSATGNPQEPYPHVPSLIWNEEEDVKEEEEPIIMEDFLDYLITVPLSKLFRMYRSEWRRFVDRYGSCMMTQIIVPKYEECLLDLNIASKLEMAIDSMKIQMRKVKRKLKRRLIGRRFFLRVSPLSVRKNTLKKVMTIAKLLVRFIYKKHDAMRQRACQMTAIIIKDECDMIVAQHLKEHGFNGALYLASNLDEETTNLVRAMALTSGFDKVIASPLHDVKHRKNLRRRT